MSLNKDHLHNALAYVTPGQDWAIAIGQTQGRPGPADGTWLYLSTRRVTGRRTVRFLAEDLGTVLEALHARIQSISRINAATPLDDPRVVELATIAELSPEVAREALIAVQNVGLPSHENDDDDDGVSRDGEPPRPPAPRP